MFKDRHAYARDTAKGYVKDQKTSFCCWFCVVSPSLSLSLCLSLLLTAHVFTIPFTNLILFRQYSRKCYPVFSHVVLYPTSTRVCPHTDTGLALCLEERPVKFSSQTKVTRQRCSSRTHLVVCRVSSNHLLQTTVTANHHYVPGHWATMGFPHTQNG